MKHEDYRAHTDAFTSEMLAITRKKNPDYSMNDDAMNNFKAISVMCGGGPVTPGIVWAVLAGKHITAIMSHMAQGKTLKDETIHGRFIDLANYAMLGDALVEDLKSQPESVEVGPLLSGYLVGQLELLSKDVAMNRTGTAHKHIFGLIQQLKKYGNQPRSEKPDGHVHGASEDVRDSSANEGSNRSPDHGRDDGTYPASFTPNDANARNAELRRDRSQPIPRVHSDP